VKSSRFGNCCSAFEQVGRHGITLPSLMLLLPLWSVFFLLEFLHFGGFSAVQLIGSSTLIPNLYFRPTRRSRLLNRRIFLLSCVAEFFYRSEFSESYFNFRLIDSFSPAMDEKQGEVRQDYRQSQRPERRSVDDQHRHQFAEQSCLVKATNGFVSGTVLGATMSGLTGMARATQMQIRSASSSFSCKWGIPEH